ncbi:MAG: diguanylate cyclase/phosphodiesterase [Blastococcus sp.]|nr:diguanylate cyclase/phosphodiesterase [Blastococcus sp.]
MITTRRPQAAGTATVPAVAQATPPARRRGLGWLWSGLSPDQRVACLAAALALLAIALFFGTVVRLPRPDVPLDLPWVVWAAAFAAGELLAVHVQVRRGSHTFSMTDVVVVAALCLAQPAAFVTAQVAGTGLVLLFDRRQSTLKVAFNLAQFGAAYCVATAIFAAVTREAAWSSPWTWVGALLALTATTLIANVLVFAAIRLSDGDASLRDLRRLIASSLPFALGTGAVGLLVVRTAVLDRVGLVLLVAPTALMIAAYRAYTHARRQEDNLRLLHEVTSLLYDGDNAHDGLASFVAAVRTAFRAGCAELVLIQDDSDCATVSRSREGQETAALLPLEPGEDVAVLLRSAMAGGTLTTRTGGEGGRGALDDFVAQRGLKDAVMSVLRTEERGHGLLLVANRLGEVSTFTDSDQRLLETFARHVATSLERGRLQTDLRAVTDLQEKLRHQALHDALTGLPNRTLFLDRAVNAVRLAGRTQAWPAVFYLDLDGFKPVNDTYGHEAGDVLLQVFGERLRSCLRSADTAARLGGDEFAVLVNGPIDADGVERVVGRIRNALSRPIDLSGGRQATVGASIGISIAGPGVDDVETLLRQADAAMYTAKRARDGRYVLYAEGLGETDS